VTLLPLFVMTLTAGTKLGCYEIRSKLGEGGMGEVYRARDEKLNRDVAIKILPEAFAQDSDRLARFKREAQVLASLNHPNIASIYGLEESNVKNERTLAITTLDEHNTTQLCSWKRMRSFMKCCQDPSSGYLRSLAWFRSSAAARCVESDCCPNVAVTAVLRTQ